MQVSFSRPLDMPLVDATKLRYGFWIDDGDMGIEAYTCGWGYTPLASDTFECISYKDEDHTIEDSHENYTFQNFSNINLLRHYDETWKLYSTDVP
jgi:hypothetical protein